MLNRKLKKIIATGVLSVMIATVALSNTAMAAPNDGTSTAQTAGQTDAQGQYSQLVVDTAKRLIDTAMRSGKQEDKDAAKLYLKTLRNSELVAVYAWRMSAYYSRNYLKEGFAYFNVSEYIKANNDVRTASSKETMPLLYALTHYLGKGMLEGRSSQTDFDPVIAILVKPECVYDALLKADPTADDVKASFKALTGKDSTKGYSIVKSSTGELLTAEAKTASTAGGGGGGGSSSGGGYTPPAPVPPTPAPQRTATYINSYAAEAAKTFVPYTFYQDKNSALNQSVLLTDADYGKVYGTFYGANYQNVKNSGKKYTMMIYMTASNQEINEYYVRVSSQIASMVKAGTLDNVNVILCVGGGGKNSDVSYYNGYMDSDIPESGLGIYYLNPSGLNSFVKGYLDQKTSEELLEDTGTGKSSETVLSYNNLINSDTLVKLFTTNSNPVDMGDPGVLAGFMNMCSQLFPAQDYGLSLSNHGGGLNSGVCFSAVKKEGSPIEGTPLTVSELETAFAATDIFKNTDATGTADGKLGLLFYDACLMGSTEQAYALKDYYRYMLGSEEVTNSYTDYYTLLTAINNAASSGTVDDAKLATDILKTFKTTTWHHGDIYDEGTIAAYSSADVENAVKAISTVGTDLAGILDKNTVDTQGTLSNRVFTAVRRSLLSCNDYQSNSAYLYGTYKNMEDCVDTGEFFTYLKKNISGLIHTGDSLTGQQIADNATIQKLLGDIDAVLNQGYITNANMYYSKASAVDSGDSATTVSIKDIAANQTQFWKDYNGSDSVFYGASVYLPYLGFVEANAGTLWNSKYIGFKDSALGGYINFLNKYLECNNNYSGPVIKSSESGIHIADICTPSEIGVQIVDGVEYLTFEFKTVYTDAQLAKFDKTSGSPMQDVAERAGKFEMVLVKEDGTDMKQVYALKNVNAESIKLDANKIVLDVADIKSAEAYYIQGSDNVKYYLPLSQIEFDESEKSSVKAAATSKVGEQKFLTFKGSTGLGDTTVTPVSKNVYHIFLNDGLSYVCTVKTKDIIDPEKPEDKYEVINQTEGTLKYDSLMCYSYTFNQTTGKLVCNSDTDKYWTLDSVLGYEYLYGQEGTKAGKIDIRTTGVAITTDGENCTDSHSLAGATPVPVPKDNASNGNEEQTVTGNIQVGNGVAENIQTEDTAMESIETGSTPEESIQPESSQSDSAPAEIISVQDIVNPVSEPIDAAA